MKSPRRIPLIAVLVFSNAMLAACGGDDGGSATVTSSPTRSGASPPTPGSSPPPATSNRAPTISGKPLTSIMQGSTYSFTPNVVDDGNVLVFKAANLPPWASFDSTTGVVTGTPSAADVGTYADVTISVSDGAASATLPPFSIHVVGTATGSATLLWNPPTQNTDGSPLTNLAGYRVYWGTALDDYSNSVTIKNPGLSSYVVEQLTPATWYFALTAINTLGAESGYSNIATKTVN